MLFDRLILFFAAIVWLGLMFFLRQRKQKTYSYLLLFTLFYIYLYKVLDYTLLQFQSLLLLKYFMPSLKLNGLASDKTVNLLPIITLTPQDLTTSLLNILLFVPFGFGLPFITRLRMQKIVLWGALVSVSIEVLQFTTGRIAQMTFRIADINDVLFNTLGTIYGYVLFLICNRIYRIMRHYGQRK